MSSLAKMSLLCERFLNKLHSLRSARVCFFLFHENKSFYCTTSYIEKRYFFGILCLSYLTQSEIDFLLSPNPNPFPDAIFRFPVPFQLTSSSSKHKHERFILDLGNCSFQDDPKSSSTYFTLALSEFSSHSWSLLADVNSQ